MTLIHKYFECSNYSLLFKKQTFSQSPASLLQFTQLFSDYFWSLFPCKLLSSVILLKKLQELFIYQHRKFLLLVVLLINPISCVSVQSAYHPSALTFGNFVFLPALHVLPSLRILAILF